MNKKFLCLLVWGAVAIAPSLYAGTLVSVDFNAPNPYFASPTFSGVEPAAAALDPLFAAANVWNGLNVPFLLTGADINPSWGGLVDSSGAATGIGFSIEGNVLGWSSYGASPSYSDALRNDYFAFNSRADNPGRDLSTTIFWALTGLVPNARYDMCFYGARADTQRGFDMTVGTTTQYIPTLLATDPQPSGCVGFRGVYANATGTILGIGTGIGSNIGVANEANLAGFQIAEVSSATPEPSSLVLLGSGLLGLTGVIRRKLSH